MKELIELDRDRALRFIKRYIKNTQEAEDILQDSILKFLLYGKDFDSSESTFITYFFTIIRNIMIDRFKNKKFVFEDLDNHSNLIESIEDIKYDSIDYSKLYDRNIYKFEMDHRIIFYRLHGCKYKKISKLTGLSVESIKLKMIRIKRSIANKIDLKELRD